MQVTGYKFTTEQEAINAREQVDLHYGIPISPNDVTQNWTDYQTAELNNPIFWYIVYDESLEIVLGLPESFNVIFAFEN
jgi:hypothetical protein